MNDKILAWLELEDRILKAQQPVETAFIAVNLAHAMIPYRQAALWSTTDSVLTLSGVAVVVPETPYVLWLSSTLRHLYDSSSIPVLVNASSIPFPLSAQWQEWLPANAVVLPIGDELLFYAREEEFTEEEISLLARLGDLVRISRQALKPKRRVSWLPKRRKVWLAVAAVLVACTIPVTGSVLAPAESVPANPTLVRAPLDGVVDRVHVRPNETIEVDQPLFELDGTTLAGRLEICRKQLETIQAEYRQAAQAMVYDSNANARSVILAGKVQEKVAEVEWLVSQLARIRVKAPRAGIAVFGEISDWLGKPVAVGEKIMVVADETDTEVEAWVSVADVGEIRKGSMLTLFLHVSPLSPVKATVRSIAYEPVVMPDSILAHRVRATLVEDQITPRLGLRGTARIDGNTVPLIWWLFRRPISVIRQFIGF